MQKTKRRHPWSLYGAGIAGILLGGSLLIRPDISARGVQDGLQLCAQTLIPSLFPFLVLSGFLTTSGLALRIGRLLEPVMRRIFHLPGAAGSALVISMLGGFPVGLRMITGLRQQGALTKNQTRRMALFCVNAGPAFILGAVGSALLGNQTAGAVLLASLCLATLLLGFLSRWFFRDDGAASTQQGILQATLSPGDAFVGSVSDAVAAMTAICAWVLLFSCLQAFLMELPLPAGTAAILRAVLEVSDGCRALASRGSLPALAAALGWCGLCVHCQLLPYLQKADLPTGIFLLARAACAVLSAAICRLFLVFVPMEAQVFSNGVSPVAVGYRYSAPAAAALLLMGAILILDIGQPQQKIRVRKREGEHDFDLAGPHK